MRFLCLSDIHGHADALSAVLATAERRGYSRVLVAGDICFPGPCPLETWRRLTQLNAVCVQGVGDRALATIDPTDLNPRGDFERERFERLIAVRAELGELILRRLAKLPQVLHQPIEGQATLALVHGSPLDPLEPITHDMNDKTVALLLGDDPSNTVLCGGSHVPFDRVVERSGPGLPKYTRVINLGSVGEAPGGFPGSQSSDITVRPVRPAGAARGDSTRLGTSEALRPEDGAGDRPLDRDAARAADNEALEHADSDAKRCSSADTKAQFCSTRFAHATFIETSDTGVEVEQFLVPLGRAA